MISLGLRFSLRGGREAGIRLALTAFGVAVGVALLLFTLSGFHGIRQKDYREGWLLTQKAGHNRIPSVDESRTDDLWWRLATDTYGADTLQRVEVAATGSRSPLPPGLKRLPRADEYYVSPALDRLLRSLPADVLRARFPGRQAGIIGDDALTSPDMLLAVVGRPVSELSGKPDAYKVRSIEAAPKEHTYSDFMRIVLGLGAVGLLIPVLVFVATSTRLAAARREERFAALRLVGATPRQVNVIASVETGVAAVAGMCLGFAAFWVYRPWVASIPITGEPFFPSDLGFDWMTVLAIGLGVPVGAVLVSLFALRRVRISPLGVTRRQTPKPPRARRLVVAVAGLVILGAARFMPNGDAGGWAVLAAFVIIIVGLMVAGPWFTMVGARLLARHAGRDSTLIAGRRLSDDPGRAFRAISGLVLAVFVGSVFIGVVGTAIQKASGWNGVTLPAETVTQKLAVGGSGGLAPAQAAPLLSRLEGLDGVRAVVPVYSAGSDEAAKSRGLVPTAAWKALGVHGSVTGSGEAVAVNTDDLLSATLKTRPSWDAEEVTDGPLTDRSLIGVVVTTASQTASERVRTVLLSDAPQGSLPLTSNQIDAAGFAMVAVLQRMVDVGIVLSLVIAGCSLAVAVAGGLIERKRPFSLLRLTGMPLSHLRRVVLLEAAVPLLLVAVISAAAGLLAADLILRATPNGFSLSAPQASYYLIMGGGIVAALAVVGMTLPLLGPITEPHVARME
jgi:hypothetical protein